MYICKDSPVPSNYQVVANDLATDACHGNTEMIALSANHLSFNAHCASIGVSLHTDACTIHRNSAWRDHPVVRLLLDGEMSMLNRRVPPFFTLPETASQTKE